MAITLNGRTKLTSDVEKALVELGGKDPTKTLTEQELGAALVGAIDRLEANGQQHILDKIYRRVQQSRPELPTIEQLQTGGAPASK